MTTSRPLRFIAAIVACVACVMATAASGWSTYADLISATSPTTTTPLGIAPLDASLVTMTPSSGPIEGGGDCTITGVSGFSLIEYIEFTGYQAIDPGVDDKGAGGGDGSPVRVVIDFKYTTSSGDSYLFGYSQVGGGAFQFGTKSDGYFYTYYSSPNGTKLSARNTSRHTLDKSNNVTSLDGSVVNTASTSGMQALFDQYGYGPLYLGGYSNGGPPSTTSTTRNFIGYIYKYQIYKGGSLVRDMWPAVWTQNTGSGLTTVYGLYDKVTQKLFTSLNWSPALESSRTLKGSSPAPAISATLGGQPLPVYLSDIKNPNTLTCGPIPAHVVGDAALTVTNGSTTLTNPQAYRYWADGDLSVVKRGWDCDDSVALDAPNAYDQVIEGCEELPSGSEVSSGTTVTWTYTATYSYSKPNAPTDSGQVGATNVIVSDDKVGPVCTIDVLYLNTPVGCVASGLVVPEAGS